MRPGQARAYKGPPALSAPARCCCLRPGNQFPGPWPVALIRSPGVIYPGPWPVSCGPVAVSCYLVAVSCYLVAVSCYLVVRELLPGGRELRARPAGRDPYLAGY